MSEVVLNPELEDYIYHYCQKFQTADELTAGKTLMYTSKTTSEGMLSMMLEKGWISKEPAILNMIADGYQSFKRRVVERIWREHANALPLNLCPKCYKIARTPEARQCRFCHHDWHGTSV
jgi:hypothetical protein